ncbi:MAG TPA: YkvA family protein [Candidatus Binatus sp.]|nr:YkvA family protein [Candidatus Binatus sp.]
MARIPVRSSPGAAALAGSRRARRGRSSTLRRLLAVLAFLPIASRAPLYARLLWALLADHRTPASHKAMLAGAVGYVALGRDLVPDDIPILGSLDDLVVVALALDVFFSGIDDATLDEKLAQVGIPRSAYEEDVARVRRLLPGPIRRVIRRLPGALGLAAQAIRQRPIGPRLRAFVTREGSIA